MSRRLAFSLLVLLVLALLVGTQMPGAWRSGLQDSLHAPLSLSSWAHFVLFASMALLLRVQPLGWPAGRVLLVALTFALLTEGLQFVALERHPGWRDVGIDMAGALFAIALVLLNRKIVCIVQE